MLLVMCLSGFFFSRSRVSFRNATKNNTKTAEKALEHCQRIIFCSDFFFGHPKKKQQTNQMTLPIDDHIWATGWSFVCFALVHYYVDDDDGDDGDNVNE